MTTINEQIVDELGRQGVAAVFALMSEETARLIVEVDRRGIPLYSTRHDSTAVGMADGYARASGKVGVAIVGRGPGLTNALNPLVTAAKAGSGLVVLIGNSPIGVEDPARATAAAAERVGKHIDQVKLLEAVSVPSVMLRTPTTAIAELGECFDRARRGEVVAVNLPIDVLEASPTPAPGESDTKAAEATLAPAEDDIKLVADLLGESWATSHPVILAGHGAVAAGAGEQLRRLGQMTGALMATSLLANSFFRGDEYNVGVLGTMATPVASELVSQADVILVFGASLNQYTTYRGDLVRGARIIQFDSSPKAAGRYQPAELAIVADARLAATALADELERRGHSFTGYRTPEVAGKIEEFRLEDTVVDHADGDGLDPRMVMIGLDKVLPRERTLVIDGGHHLEFSATHIRVPDPQGFVFPNEYFSVGTGLAAALGAAVARPERLTVLDVGDGGMMMNLGDLDTAIRYRLPMVVIVTNDGGFGSEVHYLQVNGLPDETARYINPSFSAIAKGMGARAISIESLDDLAMVPEALRDLAGPLVLDCKVTTAVRANWVDFLFTKAKPREQ
ncbi:MAG: thiamine pyrophosphate-binding protein [Candidatus Dormibacteria bacterium]